MDKTTQDNTRQSKQQSSKFDLNPGDLKFFNTKKELEEYVKKQYPNRKIVK